MSDRTTLRARHLTVAQAKALQILRDKGGDAKYVIDLLRVMRFVSEHIVHGDDAQTIADGIERMNKVWQEREWLRDELVRTNRDSLETSRRLASGDEEKQELCIRLAELEATASSSADMAETLNRQLATVSAEKDQALQLIAGLTKRLKQFSRLAARMDRLGQRLQASEQDASRFAEEARQAKAALLAEHRHRQEQVQRLLDMFHAQHDRLLDLIERLSLPPAPQPTGLETVLPLTVQTDRRITHLERNMRDLESRRADRQYDDGYRHALEAENARLRAQLEHQQQELNQLRDSTAQTFRQMAENSRRELDHSVGWVRKRLQDT